MKKGNLFVASNTHTPSQNTMFPHLARANAVSSLFPWRQLIGYGNVLRLHDPSFMGLIVVRIEAGAAVPRTEKLKLLDR